MNPKQILLNVGDLSVSQLLICQVATAYFKSKEYQNSKLGLSEVVLKMKDDYLASLPDKQLQFLFQSLVKMEVLTHDRHPAKNLEVVMAGAKISSKVSAVRVLDKPVTERQKEFEAEVMAFTQYPIRMLQDFFGWWGAIDKNKQKMRCEDTEYFETGKRLATWARKNAITANTTNRLDFQFGN